MLLSEKLCRLCGSDLKTFVYYQSIKHLIVFQKLELPLLKEEAEYRICTYCYSLLNNIQTLIQSASKVQDFFEFLNTIKDINDKDINQIRNEYEINFGKNDQSTDTDDLNKIIENSEFVIEEKKHIDCGELDFAEIPTIEQNFVISEETEQEIDEIEISYTTTIDHHNQESNETPDEIKQLEYGCHVCSSQFENFIGLYNHARKIHDTQPQVVCSCKEILSTRAQINSHKKLHSTDKSFKCNYCNKVYSHQQSLQNHLKRFHAGENKKDYKCNKCQRNFDNERKLKIHEQIHLPDDEKLAHPCPYSECNKSFSKSVNVQAHIKAVHNKERSFLCSDCGKKFCTKGALKEHQIIHSSSYPYSCKFCSKKFKNLPRLKTHEDIHGKTQYICNICGISLNTKRTLKMHMVVHSDHKKFKCTFCQSSFKRSKALKAHLILHSGLRPYTCQFCSRTFSNGSNCRSHKKKAHPNELAEFEKSGEKISTPNIPRLQELLSKNENQLLVESFEIQQDAQTFSNLPSVKEEHSINKL